MATSLQAAGAVLSSGAIDGIGYSAGAGAAVTQATNRATAVTINAVSGQITGNNTSLAAAAEAIFTVNNAAVGLQDVPQIALQSGPTANTSIFTVNRVFLGGFDIRIRNLHATVADTGAPVINFVVLKGTKV